MADKDKTEVKIEFKEGTSEEMDRVKKMVENGDGFMISSSEQLATDDRIPPEVKKQIGEFIEMLEGTLVGDDVPQVRNQEELDREMEHLKQCTNNMARDQAQELVDSILLHGWKTHGIPKGLAHVFAITSGASVLCSAILAYALHEAMNSISVREDASVKDKHRAKKELEAMPDKIYKVTLENLKIVYRSIVHGEDTPASEQ